MSQWDEVRNFKHALPQGRHVPEGDHAETLNSLQPFGKGIHSRASSDEHDSMAVLLPCPEMTRLGNLSWIQVAAGILGSNERVGMPQT